MTRLYISNDFKRYKFSSGVYFSVPAYKQIMSRFERVHLLKELN